METLDRRQRKKQQTRAAIQATAIGLFTERGYRETTIAAIADAADVAIRTVTGHFPTKEDLLFADDPFTAASLAERLDAREDGEPALDAFRDWMATTMAALTAERSREFWRQRWLRSRLILENPELRGRSRSGDYEHERVLAAAIAADRGEAADALAPRLVATTVTSGVREVYASYEARPDARAPSPDDLLALVDDVIAFARTGVQALTRSSGPGRGRRSARGASAATPRARG